LPFAPKSKEMIHQVQVLHFWKGEAVALKKCQELVAKGTKIAGKPLTCPEVPGCNDGGTAQCIPENGPPIIPGGVGLGFSAQLQLALENISQIQNSLKKSAGTAGGTNE
jgi:hypothetical protein